MKYQAPKKRTVIARSLELPQFRQKKISSKKLYSRKGNKTYE